MKNPVKSIMNGVFKASMYLFAVGLFIFINVTGAVNDLMKKRKRETSGEAKSFNLSGESL